VNIVKIGGGRDLAIQAILADIKTLDEPSIIVHGANAWRDELAAALGYEVQRLVSEKGQTSVYSDERLMDIQLMSYAGLRNKRLVEAAQKMGINAIGLTGLDGGLVRAKRNPGIRVNEDGKRRLVHDLSGKPQGINRPLLAYLLTEGYLPVLTVPFLDEAGQAVNSENDDLVALLHRELGSRRIFFCLEAPGLLRDGDDPDSLIPSLGLTDLHRELEGSQGRIKRKLHALKQITDAGSTTIHICDGRVENPLLSAIEGGGTCLRA
jgi:acetylglutamate/LysW-gamma-L-alpha-aminoadipate kinase